MQIIINNINRLTTQSKVWLVGRDRINIAIDLTGLKTLCFRIINL